METVGTLHTIARHLVLALQPLKAGVSDLPAFRSMLFRLGWDVKSLPPEYTAFATKLDAATAALEGLSSNPTPDQILNVFDKVKTLYVAMKGVTTAPAGVNAAEFLPEIGQRLFELLLADYLSDAFPSVHSALFTLDILTQRYVEATSSRPGFLMTRFQWEQIPRLISNPGSLPSMVYGWGTDRVDFHRLASHFLEIFISLDWPAYLEKVDRRLGRGFKDAPDDDSTPINWALKLPFLMDNIGGKEIELGLALLELPAQGGKHAGLILQPLVPPEIGTNYNITDHFRFELRAGSDVAKTFGVLLRPGDISVKFPRDDGSALPQAGFGATLRYAPDTPALLLGDATATRLSMEGAATALDLDVRQDGVELKIGMALNGLSLLLAAKDQDGFLSSIIGGRDTTIPIPITIQWSNRSGLSFAGGMGFMLSQSANLNLGPATIQELRVALRATTDASHPPDLIVETGASIGGRLGPVGFSAENIGLRFSVEFRDGNAGPFEIDLGFMPPSGIGLSVEAQGVVTGGGFLFHDSAQQLYAGVMQLSLQDRFTVTAFGLIATRMPDGSKGYSLLIFITVEDFRPIPLGLGFTLQGVGGMIAVNRTFDQDTLREGMRNDSLKALLFPRDAITNAPAIVRSLATAFPARRGSYLFGLLAKIGWFTPTLIELDLALIMEFGARRRLLVLGRVSSLLPSRDNDLIRINLDAIGVLDFDQGVVAIDAVLIDSRLAHKFAMTGAAALRASWGSGPDANFVLAIGGFNPRFAPPAGVPPLARITIALCSGANPRLTCEAYLAITANTYQFGARAQLYAEAHSFSIEGDVSFDVLISRAPLHFIADFHASVQLKRGSHNLFKVSVSGSLEGPRPLHLSGKASFEIFWCDFTVRIDRDLIKGARPPPPPAIDVLTELKRALSTAQSWSTRPPANRTHGVALRKLPQGTALVLDPLGRLAVSQDVVPLNTGRDIEIFGGAPVAGARRFSLSVTLNNIDLTDTTVLQALFARSQFFSMSDDEKLASRSFEQMDAGLIVGSEAVDFDSSQLVAAPVEFSQIVIDSLANANSASASPDRYSLPASQLAKVATSGAAARAPVRRVGRARFRTKGSTTISIAAPSWSIVPLDGGAPVALDPKIKTWSEHLGALASLNRGGARYQLVPSHETAR